MHNVKKPFMCRISQFTPGGRNLCVGISLKVLESKPIHEFTIGKNPLPYKVDCAKVLQKGEVQTIRGKEMIVIPVDWCE